MTDPAFLVVVGGLALAIICSLVALRDASSPTNGNPPIDPAGY